MNKRIKSLKIMLLPYLYCTLGYIVIVWQYCQWCHQNTKTPCRMMLIPISKLFGTSGSTVTHSFSVCSVVYSISLFTIKLFLKSPLLRCTITPLMSVQYIPTIWCHYVHQQYIYKYHFNHLPYDVEISQKNGNGNKHLH